MKACTKRGTVSTFFTYWEGPGWSKWGWNEIDIEIVPSMSEPVSTNIISQNQTMDQHYVEDFKPWSTWNDYVIEWKPDYIAWEINGVQVRKVENTKDVHFENNAQNVFANFW